MSGYESDIGYGALQDLVGLKVAVRSNPTGSSDCEDVGILESYDFPWIRLRTKRNEVLCFPVYNIRLVKALEKVEPIIPPEEKLLRAAAAEGEL